jgi:hypothetical protein
VRPGALSRSGPGGVRAGSRCPVRAVLAAVGIP